MSSVGQVVGGIVGAVVGFFAGGNVVLGAQIGMMIGGAIDPPKLPTLRGPRLEDLNVQTATYGAFIPRVYGTTAIHGNVFWVQGDKIIEVKVVTESGGKGGSSQKTESFEYYATFAVGLCEGPIEEVRRIWIGGQLWYDAGAQESTETTRNFRQKVIVSGGRREKFTLYKGTETQLADPLMQADKGIANVSAHRGLAYIVFDMLPLKDYSNSLMGAQVKVEIVKSGTFSNTLEKIGELVLVGAPYSIAINNEFAYIVESSAGLYLSVVSVADPAKPRTVSRGYIATGGAVSSAISIEGDKAHVSDVNGFMRTINLEALPPSLASTYSFPLFGGLAPQPNTIDVRNGIAYVTCRVSDSLHIISVENSNNIHLVSAISIGGVSPESAVLYDQGYLYVSCGSSNHLNTFDVRDPTAPVLVNSITVNAPRSVAIKGNVLYLHANTNYLRTYDISVPGTPSFLNEILAGSLGSFSTVVNEALVSASTGLYGEARSYDIRTPTTPVIGPGLALSGNYLSRIASANGVAYTIASSSNHLEVLFPVIGALSTSTVPLSSIVSAECLKSKLLTSADIDVTELTDQVRGYRIGALGAIRSGLDPLRAAWPFDVIQDGYKIKFKKRGSASVATISAGELDARAAGDAPGVSITDVREMDLILPYKVGIKYLDSTREYDLNEQYAERLNTDAVNEVAVDLPIVFTAIEAAGKAETLLYLYWLERYDVMLTLPPSYARLQAGDVITVNATFATYSLRLVSTQYLADGRIDCRAKYNSASIYTPAAKGGEGSSLPGTLTLTGPTTYQLLDIPMLRDVDNVPGFPVAMTGYLAGWPGGVVFRSEDAGETWRDIVALASPGTVIGYATNALVAHGGTVYDFSSTLTVQLYSGTVSSVTEAQLFASQNWFAYGADGRWEIIAARTATLQGDGSYILRDFLRGQLGTEFATGLHALNDSVVRLNAADLNFVNVNSSTIGGLRHYRGITAGKSMDSDSNRAFTYRGVNLECLNPVHATGNRHPTTNDWTLEWTRRTRFAGWRDLVDAVLGETVESYEVEIFSSNTFATLKRTLTSATPTVVYTSANQVTDFGSNQPTIHIKIYQLSATVGRGYALTLSITR